MPYCLKCPICGAYLPLLKTVKGKSYCVCKDCGINIMIAGKVGNDKLEQGQAVAGSEVEEGQISPKSLAYYKGKIGAN